MNFHFSQHGCARRTQASNGFSVWELLALLVVMFLIVGILLPKIVNRGCKASRVACAVNLKQISLGMHLWLEEGHRTNFPMHISRTNGGSKELTARGWVAPTFWAISNQLQNPAAATCPNDKKRMPPATSFNSITDRKVSYFLNLGATIDRPAVLAGDRNVATNGVGLPGGIAQIQDVQTVSWTKAIHKGEGYVSLADGSAHAVTSRHFQDFLNTTMTVTNALVIP